MCRVTMRRLLVVIEMSRYESDGRRSHVLVNSMSGSALRYSCRTNMLSCRKVTEA